MGTLLLHDGASARMFPLAPSTLVGRAWTCLARVEHPACPLYWVELRWMAGAWAWRALGAQARTRGAGARLREDWRALASAFGRGGRITLDDACSIELVDDSPPVPFAVDALTGVPIDADDLQELAEVRLDGIWPLEGSAREGYGDGQIFVSLGRVLRAHVPGAVAHTAETRVDLARADVRVVIDEGRARATFLQGASSVEVEGACVGVLAVYAGEPEAFDRNESMLLESITNDIARHLKGSLPKT